MNLKFYEFWNSVNLEFPRIWNSLNLEFPRMNFRIPRNSSLKAVYEKCSFFAFFCFFILRLC